MTAIASLRAWRNALTLTLTLALLLAAQAVLAGAREIRTIVLTVSDIERAVAFYEGALGFERAADRVLTEPAYRKLLGAPGVAVRNVVLRLGAETIQLEQHTGNPGRPIPADSRSNDLWFQHFAIVVSDMDRAYERLRRHRFEPISTAPQTIPESNVGAAGIRAYKFRDPDGHPLELIYFPKGKGAPRWQTESGRLFLGIDHSAIAVADTAASLAFYRDLLGFTVAGSGENSGETQAALDAVRDPVVRITGLRPRSENGPGLEFLQYVAPGAGRAAPAVRVGDLVHVRLVIEVDDVEALLRKLPASSAVREASVQRADDGARRAVLIADPDGHALLLVDG
jgi:catechol 2,3-dioxygenase-like lactoylglutathione lyase family enzyme